MELVNTEIESGKKYTISELSQLANEGVLDIKDVIEYCVVNFGYDWDIISYRYRAYKSYRLALKKTFHKWARGHEEHLKMKFSDDPETEKLYFSPFSFVVNDKLNLKVKRETILWYDKATL